MGIELSAGRIAANRAVFDWCVRSAEHCLNRGHEIQAARWCRFAAETAGFGCGFLASPELEFVLLQLAQRLQVPPRRTSSSSQRHWLHVMSRTDRIGGHNALLKRWISLNPGNDRHSVVVLEHLDPAETELELLVDSCGGAFVSLIDAASRPLDSAKRLRALAWSNSDVVVLHHHMWDVVPTMAFGVEGGPPVFLMNMADHLFWSGVSIADCILELRLEGIKLSQEHRGTRRSYLLQVPLTDQSKSSSTMSEKTATRKALGIDEAATVFLTVGRASKFEPREGVDFLATARALLRKVPDSVLIAVGPSPQSAAWEIARKETNGRLVAVGNQTNLQPFHAAADIYLEGFPFGSLTALLEAGLAGLPCVRAPGISPAIFRATGSAIDHLPVPNDQDAYIREAVSLAGMSQSSRIDLGVRLAAKIDRFHRTGWIEQLSGIPEIAKHELSRLKAPLEPLSLSDAKLLRWVDGSPLASIFWQARRYGMKPMIDAKLVLDGALLSDGASLLGEMTKLLLWRNDLKPQLKFIS